MPLSADRFEDIIALAPKHESILISIRTLVKNIHPASVETVRVGDRAVTWGWGPAKMKEGYVYAIPYASHVNLGFYQGAALPDPENRLEGTGKDLRHVKIKAVSDLASPAIQHLIEAARDCRRITLKMKGN